MTDDEIVAAISARVDAGRGADSPEPFPQDPASEEALAEAEQTIGFPLPPLLRRLYLEVANGGFGPFGGVEGVEDGYASEDGMLVDYVQWRDEEIPDDVPAWTPGVVSFCNFGGAMWALLDCRTPEGRMLFLDQSTLHPLDLTLSQWFERWLSDDLDMHKLVTAGRS
ncbi:SMI1/KNR4 family protein [Actinoplanes sp. NPDC048791]|uniref:SMI1/KNR4 family protein n=1 Tax=Actinoplanes sp. NPDC048791 TaxID=3154623 RepID=UPI00341119EC